MADTREQAQEAVARAEKRLEEARAELRRVELRGNRPRCAADCTNRAKWTVWVQDGGLDSDTTHCCSNHLTVAVDQLWELHRIHPHVARWEDSPL